MRALVRDHVPAVSGLLTVASLFLVFGAVLGALPTLPRVPESVLAAIPTVNAILSLVAIGTISGGWVAIRRGHVQRHRTLMLVSLALFATFLALYLYRISLVGPTEFSGPAVVEHFVYLPILAVHIVLAIVCIPLLYYVALLGLTRPVSAIFDTRHRQIGRIAASLWLVSFALGIVVYTLLYRVY